MVLVGVKLPLILVGWIVYKAINDVPEIEIEDEGGGFDRDDYEPGPRRRGPHGGPAAARKLRRRDKGHDENAPAVRRGTGVNA